MRAEDRIRLQHILDAAREVEEFTAGVSYDNFRENRLLANAVVRSLEVLGEAAAQISAEQKQITKEIPWRDIVSMRNRLIHAYFDVNYTVVWRTVKNDVPVLMEQLKLILQRTEDSEKESKI